MTFLEPDPTGVAGALGLNGDAGLPPIQQNAPNALKALTRKWAGDNLSATQQAYGAPLTNSLVQWELQRAQRGVAPTTPTQTLAMLKAAQTRQAQTPAPERDPWDILGNAASDIGQIASSIPKAPFQLASDVMQAPKALDAIGSGDINKIANAPIIRDIPGVYTASNLAQGNFSELASHPIQTALDVAPFAHAVGAGDMVRGIPVPGSEEGLNVGDVVDRTKAALGRTLPGQFLKQTFGSDVRDVSRIMAEQPERIHQAALPQLGGAFNSGLDQLRQQSTTAQMAIDHAVPDVARQGVIKSALEDPTSVGATDANSALDAIGASDAERGAVHEFTTVRNNFQQYGIDAGQLMQRVVNGVPEIYTNEAGAKIDNARNKVARIETLTNLRSAVVNPDAADLSTLRDQVQQAVQNPALKAKDLRNIATGYVHALDVAGYDTGSYLRDINASGKARMADLVQEINHNTLDQPGTVIARPARGVPALDSRTRWLERNNEMTETALNKARAATGVKEANILPARWDPAFQRIKMDVASNYLEQTLKSDDPALPGLLDQVHGHIYNSLGEDEIRTINAETLAQVNALRDQGINPEFVHHVSPDQERALASPSVTTIVPKASQYGTRINDWTPSADSLSVSLNHQGMELARQEGARAALDQIRDAHTVSVRDATADMRPVAERAAQRRGTDVGTELERLMRQQYDRWSETENGFMAGRGKPFKFSETSYKPDDLLVPKTISRSLQMMASPPVYSRMFDPVTRLFRNAVLPFSPRFLTHHIGGGMLMNVLEDPRIALSAPEGMAFARDISGMQKAMAAGQDYALADNTTQILERMPESMRAQINGLKYSVEPDQAFKLKAGSQLGEFAQKAGIDRILKAGGKVADWSYNTVNTMDTMYRAAAYLSGEKTALTEGLSAEEAGARGMALVNKTMPRWLEMTPMERSVLRAVFPFYGFMSHIMRYAGRFAIDHPWRVATMAAISRSEIQDFGTGLPQALASSFFLPTGKDGNATAINLNLVNPFRSLGDDLTVAGFMGNVHPAFKVAMQQLGYDPVSAGPNLYPQVEYDPTTGKFKAQSQSTPGLLGSVAGAIIPQVNILRALTGTSGDFRNLLEQNPDAASRMLGSAGGIPIAWKQYNLNNESFSSELNRITDQKNALSQAMKTGDYSHAMRYPGLAPYIHQLQKMQAAGTLAPYESPAAPASLAGNNAQQQQTAGQATSRAENAA